MNADERGLLYSKLGRGSDSAAVNIWVRSLTVTPPKGSALLAPRRRARARFCAEAFSQTVTILHVIMVHYHHELNTTALVLYLPRDGGVGRRFIRPAARARHCGIGNPAF